MAGCSGDTSACASKYNDVGYAAAPELSIEAIKTGNVTANQDLEVFIPQIPKLGRVLTPRCCDLTLVTLTFWTEYTSAAPVLATVSRTLCNNCTHVPLRLLAVVGGVSDCSVLAV
jgi:hypothetical protein